MNIWKERANNAFWWCVVGLISTTTVLLTATIVGLGCAFIVGAAKWFANTHMGLAW